MNIFRDILKELEINISLSLSYTSYLLYCIVAFSVIKLFISFCDLT